MRFVNPLLDAPTIAVVAVGEADGARGVAAALACAGADLDAPALFIDMGGRPARPALLTSTAAQKLEERLVAHLPELKPAARGQVCHLAVPAAPDGVDAASAAVSVARGACAVLYLPPSMLQPVLAPESGVGLTGVLLRADLAAERALVALAVRDLFARELAVAVLKHRLGWVSERRALFGALPAGSPGGLPPRLVRRLGLVSRDKEIPVPVQAAAS
ncbi:MAG TPA: hypothetical protein VFL77_10790 [Solirubrobacterales bacterium]|nr:hypothetical protein [Solirubrobacterales bacterium]